MKNLKIITSLIFSTTLSCTLAVPNTTEQKNTTVSTVTTTETKSVSKVSEVSTKTEEKFEVFPETQGEVSTTERTDLETYIQKNSLLKQLSYSAPNYYKVNFTSDGGAVFFVKVTNTNELLWKRESKDLVFDILQINDAKKDNNILKYYARYSQINNNNLSINNVDGTTTTKVENLVQTAGLSLIKETNGYKISNLTPIVIRQVKKNELLYKIEKVVLSFTDTSNQNKEFIIDSERALIPWSGLKISPSSKVKVTTYFSNTETLLGNSLASIVAINGEQFQINRENDNKFFSGEIKAEAFKESKGSLVIELIDKKSLTVGEKYNGYTWIIPTTK